MYFSAVQLTAVHWALPHFTEHYCTSLYITALHWTLLQFTVHYCTVRPPRAECRPLLSWVQTAAGTPQHSTLYRLLHTPHSTLHSTIHSHRAGTLCYWIEKEGRILNLQRKIKDHSPAQFINTFILSWNPWPIYARNMLYYCVKLSDSFD